MKECVIFFNCHGSQIQQQLLQSDIFKKMYNIKIIFSPNYLPKHKYENLDELTNEHKEIIQNADLVILQYIKNSTRKVIHHDYIKTLIKKDATVILIPHYSFSGYYYPYDFLQDDNINVNKTKEELQTYINNLLKDKKEDIIKHMNDNLEHIRKLDELCDIKCYDFIKNNYKKHNLFYNRSYPTSILFHHMVKQILQILNIDNNIKRIVSNYARDNQNIIYPQVKKILGLQFNIRFNIKCNIIEYIMCCKMNNVKELTIKRKSQSISIICLHKLIKDKTYR